ncbi:MAG: hypothetical protein E7282_00205 [Lachnospiraceae bacterium]|nr:hypothetical protein [Lachnospiraceae bacterium]
MIDEVSNIEQYISFIEELAQDHHFSDPHFSYDSGNLYQAVKKKNQKIYVSSNDGVVNGIFVWLIIQEEQYVELIVGLSRATEAWTEMIDYIEANNAGAQIDFVFNPGNTVLADILKSKNAVFEKAQKKLRLVRDVDDGFLCRAIELNAEYEGQYKDLHEKDTYWTAEKVLEASDRFRVIAAVVNGALVGYLDITTCHDENEPYALYTKEGYEEYRKDLLAKAIQLNKPRGMMVQVDADDAPEIALFEEMGFETIAGSESIYATYTNN